MCVLDGMDHLRAILSPAGRYPGTMARFSEPDVVYDPGVQRRYGENPTVEQSRCIVGVAFDADHTVKTAACATWSVVEDCAE